MTRYRFDPELASLVDLLPGGITSDAVAARAEIDDLIVGSGIGDVDTTGVLVEDREVPGPDGAPPVLVRIYTPQSDVESGGRPGYLTIHGGGFMVGSIAIEHPGAVQIARELGAVVIAVEYRLAPEDPYPAALEDCYSALRWFHDNAAEVGVDPQRIAVGGQSAGGGLAAGLALLARDRNGPAICFQLLGMPELDDRLETPSMEAFTDTPMWSRPSAVYSWQCYLGDRAGGADVPIYAAPARAEDLAGLPPAYVSTMEFDPLRDEGILYALKLLQAGVPVELHSFPGTFHGSTLIPTAAVSRRAAAELLTALRRGLGVSSEPSSTA